MHSLFRQYPYTHSGSQGKAIQEQQKHRITGNTQLAGMTSDNKIVHGITMTFDLTSNNQRDRLPEWSSTARVCVNIFGGQVSYDQLDLVG